MSPKRPSRRAIFWIVVLLQGLAIVTFAGWREVQLRAGTEVVLATVPVDPRDLFRGDHVVLRYEISRLNCYVRPGDSVYVNLRPAGDVWVAGYAVDDLDAALRLGGPVIAGRVATKPTFNTCTIEYGIEDYFVPEGTGRDIERLRGKLKVHVVLSENGSAAIKKVDLP